MILCAQAPASAFAQQEAIEYSADLNFSRTDVDNICFVAVDQGAPYGAFNGDCRVYRRYSSEIGAQEDLIAINPRQEYPIQNSSSDFTTQWVAIAWNSPPDVSSIYCAVLGWDDGSGKLPVIFGHNQDSNRNLQLPKAQECRSPEPRLKVFYQETCIGSYVQVFSIESVESSFLYRSWHEIAYPTFCYSLAVAVDTSR